MEKNFFKLFKKYKYNSVFVKTFLLVIALEVAVVGTLNIIYFYRIENNIYREIEDACVLETERQGILLDTMVEQVINFSYYITSNEEFDITLLTLPKISEQSKQRVIDSLSAGILSFQKSFDYIDSAYIYLEGMEEIITESGLTERKYLKDTEWIQRYEVLKEKPYYHIESRIQNNRYPFLMTVYYPVYKSNTNVNKIGMVVVNINMNQLSDMLGFSFQDMRNVYMITETGELLYTNNTKLLKNPEMMSEIVNYKIGSNGTVSEGFVVNEQDGKETATTTVKSSYGKWFYSMDFEMEYYEERYQETRGFMVWSAVVSLIMGLLISIILAIRTYRPIRYAIGLLESDEVMAQEILEDEKNQNELRYIFELTQRVPRGGTAGNLRSEEWMERLGKAQMHVLQSQITPHFLYNTLDAINWMVIEEAGGQNEISKSIQNLASLLRKSMNKTSYFATLQEEVEQAKLYIQVMEIQNPGKLEVTWEIPEELYEKKVVRFTLQPLLENSIRHGFAHRRYRGKIYVKADLAGDLLLLEITDDGCGMSAEACRKMNEDFANEYEIVSKHVGVQNVNQRIKIMFGEEYGLRFVPGNEEGLIIYMTLPDME